MLYSKLFIPTLREAPSDADNVSAKLMQRSGMIRKLASGIYEWLPLGLKVLKKVEQVIREEMNAVNGHEVWLPLLLPKDLWMETGRWNVYGKELFRLKDRKDSEFCLGPTHEEVITDLVRREVRSYRQLPVMLYQFGTKFRDEIRPRFGIMRAREFLMKDAYSFHADEKDLEDYYLSVFNAYKKICGRCGFQYRAVEAATGAIGGSFSHEFMVLAETGEEEIAWCDCGYGANTEKAEFKIWESKPSAEAPEAIKEVPTPGVSSVEDVGKLLKQNERKFIKTMIYVADGDPVIALIRGDFTINEHKLQAYLGALSVALADEKTIERVTGAPVGFAGPQGIKGVRLIADHSVKGVVNGVTGANRKDHHVTGVNPGRDFAPEAYTDLRFVKRGDKCAKCGKELKFARGIEVGHTFKLGLKYSRAMNASYLDESGKENLMVMGCYGIGVSRIVAATIEQSNDENGIIWPVQLAPYQAVIIPINYEDTASRKTCDEISAGLEAAGIEVLVDDRDERAGIKFKDADLIGIPFRITIGEKNLKDGKVEVKSRRDGPKEFKLVAAEAAVHEVISMIAAAKTAG